jgi:hypothetical protein
MMPARPQCGRTAHAIWVQEGCTGDVQGMDAQGACHLVAAHGLLSGCMCGPQAAAVSESLCDSEAQSSDFELHLHLAAEALGVFVVS